MSLTDLIARVEAAGPELTSYDRIGYDLLVSLLGRDEAHAWLYHTDRGDPSRSIDSALALVERMLPGWTVQLFQQDPEFGGGWIARLRRYSPYALTALDGMDPPPATPALALILALLKALEGRNG